MATREEVVATHLRFSAVAKPLRTRAHAQLLAKVLYLSGAKSYLTMSKMRDGIADLTGGTRPSKAETQAALDYLQGAELIRDKGGSRFGLRPYQYRRLKTQVAERGAVADRCLARHFPGEIDRETLATWFSRTSISFFTQFADRWVASVAGRAGLDSETFTSVMEIAASEATALGIESSSAELVDGFLRFLRSSEPEDHQHLQSLGLTAFAARLVAAGEGPDPISSAQLRDATWVLDTNVLLTIALEGVTHGDPLDALGQALSMIGAELVYVHATLVEYRQVVDRWASETLAVFDRFGIGPIKKSSNAFLKIALARHCYNRDDFVRFFSELREPPQSVEERIAIRLVDDPDVARAAAKGEENEQAVLAIQTYWAERRRRPKSPAAARHDSAVSEVVRYYRSSETRCFALTTDRTMGGLAADWQGPLGTPSWILLDALVQVLAADRAGMAEGQVDLSALLSKLVANEVGPVADEFEIRDLLWLSEIVEQVEAFPEEEVSELARIIHRARIAGASRDDSELRLALERTIQQARVALITDHDTARREEARASEHARSERKRWETVREALVEQTTADLRREARRRLFRRCAGASAVAGFLGLVLLWLVLWAGPDLLRDRANLVAVGLGIAGLVVSFVGGAIKWIRTRYREEWNRAPEDAERRARELEGHEADAE